MNRWSGRCKEYCSWFKVVVVLSRLMLFFLLLFASSDLWQPKLELEYDSRTSKHFLHAASRYKPKELWLGCLSRSHHSDIVC